MLPTAGGGLTPVVDSSSGFSEADLYLPNAHKKTTPNTEKATPTTIKPLPAHMEPGHADTIRTNTDSTSDRKTHPPIETYSNPTQHSGLPQTNVTGNTRTDSTVNVDLPNKFEKVCS